MSDQANQVVPFRPARLPYDEGLDKVYSVNRHKWRALVEAIFPLAKTRESVLLALEYCKERNLDIMKRPVHIVPMWSQERGEYTETIWQGIGELRTTAARTGQLLGYEETKWGPDVTKTFKGTVTKWVNRVKQEVEQEVTLTFPTWCRIDIRRRMSGEVAIFPGPTVYWEETYARQGKSELPNEMWTRRGRGQLEKCAEAGALRRAFPEEVGNEYAAEEMEGQTWGAAGPVIEHQAPTPEGRQKSAAEQMREFAEGGETPRQAKTVTEIVTPEGHTNGGAEPKKTRAPRKTPAEKLAAAEPKPKPEAKPDEVAQEPDPKQQLTGWLLDLHADLSTASNQDEASEIWANYGQNIEEGTEEEQAKASTFFDQVLAAFDDAPGGAVEG
jgi:phage recombination protein Bet